VSEDLGWFCARLHFHLDAYPVLSDSQVESLYRHYELLVRWNRKMNLTSIRSPEEIVVRHYCESLFFAAQVPEPWGAASFADIGSGAGFPGVPMAVLRPDWKISLVESHQRKAVFLRESTRCLGNVSVLGSRAEELTTGFDVIVSRAVETEAVLSLLPRVASRVGLLIGAADYEGQRDRVDLVWESVVPVPWGERRLAVFGSGSTWNFNEIVPRGTFNT
jgi:16S rRNA (guanine527-N7)-methyltransferase